MVGNSATPPTILSYDFASPSGSLSPDGFVSLQSRGIGGFTVLSQDATGIGETSFGSGVAVDGTGFSLGTAFVIGGSQDLVFNYGRNDETSETNVPVTYVGGTSVPEPASLGLLGLGGLALLRRRRA